MNGQTDPFNTTNKGNKKTGTKFHLLVSNRAPVFLLSSIGAMQNYARKLKEPIDTFWFEVLQWQNFLFHIQFAM